MALTPLDFLEYVFSTVPTHIVGDQQRPPVVPW
jgi:hypothetical protein